MVIGEKIAHPCPSGKSVLKIHHTKPHPNIGGVMRGHCHWVFNGEKKPIWKARFLYDFHRRFAQGWNQYHVDIEGIGYPLVI